jgi:transketolase
MQLQHKPVALLLSRQALPTLDRTRYASAEGVRFGAYLLAEAADGDPDVILIANRQRDRPRSGCA